MRIRWVGIIAALSVLSCQASDVQSAGAVSEASPPEPPVLTAEGWGPLRIGMTRALVVAAVGEDANPEAVGGPEPEQCDEFHPRDAPLAMRVMIERGHLTRITLSRGSDAKTRAGFGIGDAATAIMAAYGSEAMSTPHKYWPAAAEYITVWETPPSDAASARGIVYEVGEDARVVHVHAGTSSIQYVEGCL